MEPAPPSNAGPHPAGPTPPPPQELRDKYTRLATEYSKIRSHMNVLKKGIFDEQAKSAELKELLRERELSLRKSELEIDSLNFRNQQLTKRVTVLQDDLDFLQLNKNSKGKHKDDRNPIRPTFTSNDSILQEELQKKILENAYLVSLMSDKDFEMSQIKLRLTDAEKKVFDTETKYKCETQKLKNQNQELATSLENALSNKEKTNLQNQGTPNRSNQIPSINGDFISDVGSLIGSEDALSTEESHLHEQLSKKNELINKIEQENQTLKIEYDLLKLEIESLKLFNEQQRDSLNSNSDIVENSRNYLSGSSSGEDTSSGLLGKLKAPTVISEETLKREEHLKNYFRDKITAIVGERQHFESMTKHYIDESSGLRMQLDYLRKENHSMEEEFSNAQSTISKLVSDSKEDELHSTITNYKQQLNVMTEHVGNLNDKLAQQFEEIVHLKASSSKK